MASMCVVDPTGAVAKQRLGWVQLGNCGREEKAGRPFSLERAARRAADRGNAGPRRGSNNVGEQDADAKTAFVRPTPA